MSYLTNINIKIPETIFFEKPAFESGFGFEGKMLFFELIIVPCFLAKPVYQNVCIENMSIFTFCKQ